MRRLAPLATIAVLVVVPLPGATADFAPVEGYRLVQDLMEGDRGERRDAARRLLEARDLSLVPAIYAADFESLQTTGELSVTGRVTGRLGEQSFPAMAISAW